MLSSSAAGFLTNRLAPSSLEALRRRSQAKCCPSSKPSCILSLRGYHSSKVSSSSPPLTFTATHFQNRKLVNGWRTLTGTKLSERRWLQRTPRAGEEDFDVDEDGFDILETTEDAEDEEEDFRDYETEYENPNEYRPIQQREMDSVIDVTVEEVGTVVGWKIDEDEFHKLSLLTCDFFIRKVPDPDDDVYDFREMYVSPPDTDTYSIPKVSCALPNKPVRCTKSCYEYIHAYEPPIDHRRSPRVKTEYEVMKIFLMKHLKDRRAKHEQFMLDFEEIYVIDTVTKTFSRATVEVDVPGGPDRDRRGEVLIVREDGTNFLIIREEDQKSPDQILEEVKWDRTREEMENYLRGFRDYEISNWF